MNQPAIERFVEELGVLLELEAGTPRMVGRTLGWLLVCDPPEQSAAELAQMLQASKGSISTATRLLLRMGFIERARFRGERFDRFRAQPEAWDEFFWRDEQFKTPRRVFRLGLDALAGEPTLVPVPATLLKPDAGTAHVLGLGVQRDAAALHAQAEHVRGARIRLQQRRRHGNQRRLAGERVEAEPEHPARGLELLVAPEELVPRLRLGAETIKALAAKPGPLDETHTQQQARRRADRTLARLQHLRELGRALLRRVAHQQPTERAPDHPRRSRLELEQDAQLFDEPLDRRLVHEVQRLLNSRYIYYSLSKDVARHRSRARPASSALSNPGGCPAESAVSSDPSRRRRVRGVP